MSLSKLFEMQRELDEHIIKEKHLEDVDLLPNKILALQVKLGELANEWRGFKHWSNDQKPRTKKYACCFPCNGTGIYINKEWKDEMCPNCHGLGQVETDENPLLEEYVDCLHFILSIGLDMQFSDESYLRSVVSFKTDDIVRRFINIMRVTTDIDIDIRDERGMRFSRRRWNDLMCMFLGLGEMLGFTSDEIEQACINKNAVNHQRQVNGY